MPTVDVTTEYGEWEPQRIYVLQVTDLDPADTDTNISPGKPITFTLLNSGLPYTWDFDDGDDPWLRCLYSMSDGGNGFTQGQWNSGGGDEWSLVADGGKDVYKCNGRGTSLMIGNVYSYNYAGGDYHTIEKEGWSEFPPARAFDATCRVQFKTGGGGGICFSFRYADNYGRGTQGVRGPAAEIDSGGLRRVFYHYDNSRDVRSTSAFSPTDGEWYWVRMQCYRDYDYRDRCKYWTGHLDEEPDTWQLTWRSGDSWNYTADVNKGHGVHNYVGEMRYDLYQIHGMVNRDHADLLTVEVNGNVHSVANGNLFVEPYGYHESWNSVTQSRTYSNKWRVRVMPHRLDKEVDGAVNVVIKFDGVTLKDIDYTYANIPQDFPTYDPADSDPVDALPRSDPSRFGPLAVAGDGSVEGDGNKFEYVPLLFAELWGRQDIAYHIMVLLWPQNNEHFVWQLYTLYYTPVDGEYLIGHPVSQFVPASVVPAEAVEQVIPSSTVPRSDIKAFFPASVVPQAYFRKQFPLNLIPSYQLWWDGDSSCVVGQETLMELDASTLVFQRREGSVIHARIMSQTTQQQLIAMGIKFLQTTTVELQVTTEYGEFEEFKLDIPIGPWYSPNWDYRFKVTIDKTAVDSNLTNFPVLITEENLPAHFWANVDTDGDDIVVTASDGETKLYRELVDIDTSGETMELWVRLNLVTTADTEIFIYYGNSAATETNDTEVWTVYSAVYHMNEDTGSTLYDSTGNHNGTYYGHLPNATAGQIGDGQDLDGTGDYAAVTSHADFNPGTGEWSMEAWVQFNVPYGSNADILMFKATDSPSNLGYSFRIGDDSTGPQTMPFFIDSGGGDVARSAILTNNTRYHVAGVRRSGTLYNFVNGAVSGTPISSSRSGTTTSNFYIGDGDTNYPSGWWGTDYLGLIDEVRLSKTGHTADWMAAQYTNQKTPEVFYRAAPEEGGSTAWYNSSWYYRFGIQIQGHKVPGTVSNYDLLITEANVPDHFWDVVDSAGADIVVTAANGTDKLNRDLIHLNTTAKTMILRVGVGTVTTSGLTVWLYYGNSGASETNSTLTYDSDLEVYWPLEEDPTGTSPQAQDRTSNNRDGTSSNMEGGDLITGVVGNGWNFGGTDERCTDTGCSFSNATLTLMCWVDVDSVTATGQAMYVGSSSAGVGTKSRQGFQITAAKKVRGFYFAPNYTYIESSGTYSDKVHLTMTLTTSAQEAFANSSSIGTDTDTGRITEATQDLYAAVGVNDAGSFNEWFVGLVDEYRVWTRVLSDDEITLRYRNESSPETFYMCSEPEAG